MRVLVFGSRNWADIAAIRRALWRVREDSGEDGFTCLPKKHTVIHGDCRGADRMGGQAGRELGFRVESYPAQWWKHGVGAGPIRNQAMVNTGLDLALGFGTNGKGSRDMMRRLADANVQTKICDGGEGTEATK